MHTMWRRALVAALPAGLLVAVPGVAQASASDLVTNGGFEQPALSAGDWSTYGSISGWTADGCGVEIQNTVAGSAHGGSQLAELDSFCSSGVSQTLATQPGRYYTLSYAFAARPGVADNVLRVGWDGATLQSHSADGSEDVDTDWTTYTETVRADGAATVLSFADGSGSDSLGTYLDDVSVVAAQPPSAAACKDGEWRNWSDSGGSTFKNQGDCVSYVATAGRNTGAGQLG